MESKEEISTDIEQAPSSYSMPLDVPAGLVLTPTNHEGYLLLTFDPEPSHPRDPLCFPYRTRIYMTALAAILVLNTVLASTTPSGAVPFIVLDFPGGDGTLVLSAYVLGYVAGPFIGAPLSEYYGRRPVFLYGTMLYTVFSGACIAAPNLDALIVLRFFAGTFGSVPTTNSGAVCGDIWNARDRGIAMAFYSLATFAGPAVGPIIGAFVAVDLGWRYDFVVLTAFSGLLCVVIFFACPETYPAVILSGIAQELRKTTGNDRIRSRIEMEELVTIASKASRSQRWRAEVVRVLSTPFVMLFREPIVFFVSLYTALVYGLIYLLFATYPLIYDGVYHLAPGYSSLPFLGILFGACLSVPVNLLYQKRYLEEVEALGRHEPEMRLPMCQVGGILVVVSFFWLGWTGNNASIPWIVSALSGIPLGLASVLIFRSLQTFLIDAYEKQSASAMAANVVSRSSAGAAFPLFGDALFKKLGIGPACSLLAGLMILLVPIPFVFENYGARIRKNSRYTSGR